MKLLVSFLTMGAVLLGAAPTRTTLAQTYGGGGGSDNEAAWTEEEQAALEKLVYAVNASTAIEGDFICVFDREQVEEVQTVVDGLNQTDVQVIGDVFGPLRMAKIKVEATAANADDAAAIKRERERKMMPWLLNPLISYIEQDQTISVLQAANDGADENSGDQEFPPWGLDRIDQTNLPLNNQYHFDVNGDGVTAYIVDTGIRDTHVEFGGRAECARSFIAGEPCEDGNGHGTHVSGTIGAATFGVAKGVKLVGVKVLSNEGSGPNSAVINGVNWVLDQALASNEPSVCNLSLGGFRSRALDNAVEALVRNGGVFTAVAAGNSNEDACNSSPARADLVLSVGATDERDVRSVFSNFGDCVDIFAPGTDIQSTWINSDTSVNTISGTSMASPHIAGIAALYLADSRATPAVVKAQILNNAVENSITSVGVNSPNRLANTENLFTSTPSAPPQSGAFSSRRLATVVATTSSSLAMVLLALIL